MEKIHNWGGAFLPLRKHRDYCGDVSNHIVILSKTLLDDDELEIGGEDEYINEDGYSADELVVIGEGSLSILVTMTWKDEGHGVNLGTYEYIVNADEVLEDEDLADMLAEYIEEENARRRREGQREITDGSNPFAD